MMFQKATENQFININTWEINKIESILVKIPTIDSSHQYLILSDSLKKVHGY